ncbi:MULTISPECIES: stage II sporulation protein D [Sporosarcina]|uniref:Stage II sporulation protein D n=1 Tax=Sporosarcina psychrophila TaxID=1476 RepID=A0ABV2K2P5_SPOPS|nr:MULTISPECIES: stage II sporulation protein D [Sporosarcina]AMQ07932.1 stage II sporulation protein D [Sporosarcina psychrophila]QNK87639.1 stage II sporulation protein D [Sporosarcina sp. resist]
MDKLLTALFIILLFFIPLLLRQTPEKVTEPGEQKVELCPVDIMIAGADKPISLEEYVVGVVAAEMPATFQEEALKAQAIAARTYALQTTDNGKKAIAPDVSAQVYSSEEKRKERWGKEFKRNEKKVRAAVEATAGDTIVYQDKMISAMFFSTSNGKTETAQNFSGNDIPYLQSVESPGEGDVEAKVERTAEIPLAKWNKTIGGKWNADSFRSLQLVRNPTGRVQKVVTSEFQASGREVRELLGLASTDFDIAFDVTNKIVHVTTTGYGHGVGMSQYGAEAYAQKGWAAEKILLHYYTGTQIKKFTLLDSQCLKTPSLANNSE